jgi:hypothetical protein
LANRREDLEDRFPKFQGTREQRLSRSVVTDLSLQAACFTSCDQPFLEAPCNQIAALVTMIPIYGAYEIFLCNLIGDVVLN